MTTNIPSPQLDAITRCELAAIALDNAYRALQHPDLGFGGSVILAPSGRKHLAESAETLRAIQTLLRASHSADESDPDPVGPPISAIALTVDDFPASALGKRVMNAVAAELARDLHAALDRSRTHLALAPEFADDAELRARALDVALTSGSRLGRRINQALVGIESPTA